MSDDKDKPGVLRGFLRALNLSDKSKKETHDSTSSRKREREPGPPRRHIESNSDPETDVDLSDHEKNHRLSDKDTDRGRESDGRRYRRRSSVDHARAPRTSREKDRDHGRDQIRARDRDRERELKEREKPQEREKDRKVTKLQKVSQSKSPSTSWPPDGVAATTELPLGPAMELISKGAPIHKGYKREIPHVGNEFYFLASTTHGTRPDAGTDAADLLDAMVRPMTMCRVQSTELPEFPWDSLEQPSFGFYFGRLPGTITLNQWTALASSLPPPIPLRDSEVVTRKLDLPHILRRLYQVQSVSEDEDEEVLYRTLYRRLLHDPDRATDPHRALDRQITDLILALSRPDWIDFSNPKNQIVSRFFYDPTGSDPIQFERFLLQLLLSIELEIRINHRLHFSSAREKLMTRIPPTIQWTLAVARQWRDSVRVNTPDATGPDHIRFRYKRLGRQVKMLVDFATLMKWPNLAETLRHLRQLEVEEQLDYVSSHALAFFSGLVLPGPTWPFVLICTLIDIDPDQATDKLALLTHLQPSCGFQYHNTYTYWAYSCIVGKVLAPTARSYGGWIGPCIPTEQLGRTQIAKIRAYRPLHSMPLLDMASMSDRSDPLGPPASCYPVREYELPLPSSTAGADRPLVDSVRLSHLSFKAIGATGEEPRWFEAGLRFAVDAQPVDLRLKYDVCFLCAFPCSNGPHPLFFDYSYRAVRVDNLLSIQNWGSLHDSPAAGRPPPEDADDAEKILVIEAFGVRDNEVLARAWCAHWGLSALVADAKKTCMACAIREAYAATLTVLILIEGRLKARPLL